MMAVEELYIHGRKKVVVVENDTDIVAVADLYPCEASIEEGEAKILLEVEEAKIYVRRCPLEVPGRCELAILCAKGSPCTLIDVRLYLEKAGEKSWSLTEILALLEGVVQAVEVCEEARRASGLWGVGGLP